MVRIHGGRVPERHGEELNIKGHSLKIGYDSSRNILGTRFPSLAKIEMMVGDVELSLHVGRRRACLATESSRLHMSQAPASPSLLQTRNCDNLKPEFREIEWHEQSDENDATANHDNVS